MINIKTAIVTGAAGFVGFHLVDYLVKNEIYVVCLCRPNSDNNCRLDVFEDRVKVIECEASHYLMIAEVLRAYNPDVFFHLEWDGTTGEARMDYERQLLNVKHMCDAYCCANKIGCKKFVATGTVYQCLINQILERKDFSALSYYVMAKEFAYESLLQLSKREKLDYTWCMFCQPTGKYIKPNQLTAYSVKTLIDGGMPQYGQATEPFDMIAVEDLAEALFLAATTELSKKKYYIGSGEAKQLKEFLLEIGRVVAPEIELVFGKRESDGLKFSYEWLDVSDFMSETGFVCKKTFAQSVRDVEQWIRKM